MPTITPDTPDEAITGRVRRALQSLGDGANAGAAPLEIHLNHSESLMGLLLDVAEAEGVAAAEYDVREYLKGGHTDLKGLALVRLAAPLNDTWSGRKNDIRRARHEAYVRRLGDLCRFN